MNIRGRYKSKVHVDNVDLRDLLDSLNIHYTSSGKNVSAGWVGVQCPFCDDNHNHMGINIRSKLVSCWKCGKTGSIIQYLTRELNSFNKAMEVIGKFIPRTLKIEREMERSGVLKVELPSNAKIGLSIYHKIYLKKRGFDPEYLSEKYNLHHVGPVGKFKNRIIVPVIKNYRLMTFTSVDIADESIQRYKHLEDELSIVPMKHILYNAETSDNYNVYVVEGLFDCYRIGDGCVPTWGVKFTAEQKKLLAKFKRVTIIGDGDRDGWRFNEILGNELSAFSDVRYFKLEAGLDPDTLTKEEIDYIKGR